MHIHPCHDGDIGVLAFLGTLFFGEIKGKLNIIGNIPTHLPLELEIRTVFEVLKKIPEMMYVVFEETGLV